MQLQLSRLGAPALRKPTDDILLSRRILFCSGAGLMFPGNSLENMLFVYTLPPPQLSQSRLNYETKSQPKFLKGKGPNFFRMWASENKISLWEESSFLIQEDYNVLLLWWWCFVGMWNWDFKTFHLIQLYKKDFMTSLFRNGRIASKFAATGRSRWPS